MDEAFQYFGFAGADPVAGDWNGDGADDMAFYRNGVWWRDSNGNGVLEETFQYFGFEGADPVAGDWNSDGVDDMAIYRNGVWWRDLNGNGVGDDGFAYFGFAGADPVAGDWNGPGAALRVADGEGASAADTATLTQNDLEPILQAAVALWSETGLSESELNRLGQVTVSIADLSGSYLAITSSTDIRIDIDAAGYGWFVDQTPLRNEEFSPNGEGSELRGVGGVASQVDLLTVLVHEFGHILGIQHDSGDSVMNALLAVGVRKVPSAGLIDAVFSSATDDELFL